MRTFTIDLGGVTYADCWLDIKQFLDGSPAITLMDEEGPVTRVSVLLERNPASPDCFWIKEWSENVGLTSQLLDLGLIQMTGRTTTSGFVEVHEAHLIAEEDK